MLLKTRPTKSSRGSAFVTAVALLPVVLLGGCASEGPLRASETPVGAVSRPNGPPYQIGRASFYSDRLAGRPTASGELYDPGALTAAHRTLPFGTIVDVARPDGEHVTVRINDRGPRSHRRVIDLSRRAASQLGIIRAGVADVTLRVLRMPR